MRCLYCNKKLSLLKLAKGDSFCSPQHFDAYQLQLSKSAFDRLVNVAAGLAANVAAEEVPKAPLKAHPVVERKEEAPPSREDPPEQNTALARLSAFTPPPLPEVAPPPPPYAPFASSPLAAFELNPPFPIANAPEASEAVEPPRALSFPVHEAEEIACIFNLHLQLSLAATEPKNWTPEQHLIVAPERFRLEISQPPFGVSPEFPEIENLAPVEPVSPIEAVAPAIVQNVAPGIAPGMAQGDADHLVEPLPFAEALVEISQPPLEIRPELAENLAPVEPVSPMEALAPAEADHPVEALPFSAAVSSIKPVLHAEPVTLTPIEPPPPRVPFLIAPSFRARTGTPIVIHSKASSVPHGSILAPVLEKGALPRPDPCRGIPNSTRFSETASFHLHDSTAHLVGGPELPVEPAFVLPDAKNQYREEPWRSSDRQIVVVLPALDRTRESLRSLDCDMPAPVSLMVRPDASNLPNVDPQQLLAGTPIDVVSLFRGVLQSSPQGRNPVFVDPPADATESAWQAILAPFPRREPLPTAWQHRTSYCSSPELIATGGESWMLPQESIRYSPACIKIDHVGQDRLPAPYIANDLYQSTDWPTANSAQVPVRSESSLVFIGSTMLPHAEDVPKGGLRRGSGDPWLPWQPCPAASTVPRVIKFLPAREGAILPSAKRW